MHNFTFLCKFLFFLNSASIKSAGNKTVDTAYFNACIKQMFDQSIKWF